MENDWYKLFEQLDSISHLNDDEIKAYIANLSDEQKAMLSQIIATKRAMQCDNVSTPDIEEAWKEFSQKRIPQKPTRKIASFIRKFSVAACLIVMIVGIAWAVNSLSWFEWGNKPTSDTHVTATATTDDTSLIAITPPDSVIVTNNSSIEIYDNVTLEAVLTNMAQYYHATLQFNSRNSVHLRIHFEWDKSLPLERNIRLLNNFENVNLSLKDNVIIVEE